MKEDLNNREGIELLVDSFYKRVQNDELIGHIFTDIAKVDWHHHLPKMYDFWETILFGQKGFKGNPMEVHFKLNKVFPLEVHHFERWKEIFNSTVDQHFKGEFADIAKQKAQSIADLMLFKINNSANQIISIKNSPSKEP